jgi:hypothetical protein
MTIATGRHWTPLDKIAAQRGLSVHVMIIYRHVTSVNVMGVVGFAVVMYLNCLHSLFDVTLAFRVAHNTVLQLKANTKYK